MCNKNIYTTLYNLNNTNKYSFFFTETVTSQPKQITSRVKESGPKRALNLDEYKKRHGLI